MTDTPERIWAWPRGDWEEGGCSTEEVVVAGSKDVEYILATPERELASELAEALRGLIKHVKATEDWMHSNGYDESPDREALKYPRAVLAKLDEGK